eukprot:TRINITY_DN16877_c0_g1_i1.p1 TRINITY_DN16877_c0_g1~~TRINITY_DN16877_c0_g1_i1.p1  ORF type:complete len:380 (+),score=82.28 TRINITY_DN16877_c0_g1_i1:100-1239(+)
MVDRGTGMQLRLRRPDARHSLSAASAGVAAAGVLCLLLALCSLTGSIAFASSWVGSIGASSKAGLRGTSARSSRMDSAVEDGSINTLTSLGSSLLVCGVGILAAGAMGLRATQKRNNRIIVYSRNYETNIKKKKGPAELRKAQLARKHLQNVTLAIKAAGPDEDFNRQLRTAIRAALKDNVPRDTITRRIKRFMEEKEVVHELEAGGFNTGGCAVLVKCVTDNTARTRTALKEAFKEGGGSLGNDGTVDHIFAKRGVLKFTEVDEEKVMEASLEADVEDCEGQEDGSVVVTTLPENYHSALQAFEDQELDVSSHGVEFLPVQQTQLGEEGTYCLKLLMHHLSDCEDVQGVYHNGILQEDVELKFSNYGIPFGYERSKKA